MVETDDGEGHDGQGNATAQAPEGNLCNCTSRENYVKVGEDVVLASKTGTKVESRVRPFDGVRPLTLLSQHVKHTALSTHYSLTWLPALVTMIITNQLESNAWTSARHPSPMDWWSKCH